MTETTGRSPMASAVFDGSHSLASPAFNPSESSAFREYPWLTIGNMSTTQLVFTLAQICTGVGLLALPYAFALSGFAIGVVGVLFIAFVNAINSIWLVKAKDVMLLYSLFKGKDPHKVTFENFQQRQTVLSTLQEVNHSNSPAKSIVDCAKRDTYGSTDDLFTCHSYTDEGGLHIIPKQKDSNSNLSCQHECNSTENSSVFVFSPTPSSQPTFDSFPSASDVFEPLEAPLESGTFGYLSRAVLGPFGPALVDICIIATLFGCATLYLITIGDLLGSTTSSSTVPPPTFSSQNIFSTFWHWLSSHISLSSPSRTGCILFVTTIISPLMIVRDLSGLSFISYLGISVYISGVCVILYLGYSHYEGDIFSDFYHTKFWVPATMYVPDSAAASISTPIAAPLVLSGWDELRVFSRSIFQFVGMIAFSFGVPVLTFDLSESMRKPQAFKKSLTWTVGSIGVIYCLVGIILALMFSRDPVEIAASFQHGRGHYFYKEIQSLATSSSSSPTYAAVVAGGTTAANSADPSLFTSIYANILAQSSASASESPIQSSLPTENQLTDGIAPLVLLNLPVSSWLTVAVKISIVITIICSLPPSILVPALNLLENRIFGPISKFSSVEHSVEEVADKTAPVSITFEHSRLLEKSPHLPNPHAIIYFHDEENSRQSYLDQSYVNRNEYCSFSFFNSVIDFKGSLWRNITRLALTWCCALAAINIPCFSLIMSLVGSGTMGLLCFALPPFFILAFKYRGLIEIGTLEYVMVIIVFIFGFAAVGSSLYLSFDGTCS